VKRYGEKFLDTSVFKQ